MDKATAETETQADTDTETLVSHGEHSNPHKPDPGCKSDSNEKYNDNSLKSKLRRFFRRKAREIREQWDDWAVLMPAKSHLDSEYNFPAGRWAGMPPEMAESTC